MGVEAFRRRVEGGRGSLTGIVRVRVWALATQHQSSVGQLKRQILMKAERGLVNVVLLGRGTEKVQ